MIGRLHGTVIERGLDGACIVDVGGVGYEVSVPIGTLGRLPDGVVTLYVHTHVREDALTLYGFSSLEDRAAFRALLSVSTIGPKTALAVVSHLDANALAHAIALQDRAAFKGIPGVAKKTVERVLLDLKDKLLATGLKENRVAHSKPVARASNDPLQFVSSTLVSMGYKPNEADRAISLLSEHADGKPVETLLREALAALS